jgi:mono/diheme cytochrome c family protein
LKGWALLLLALLTLPLLAGCEDTRDRSAPALYKRSCARCHGAQGQGPARPVKLYPYLSLLSSPMVRRGDRTAVRQRIVDGRGPMPSFRRRLSREEVERLVDFTLQLPSRKAGD